MPNKYELHQIGFFEYLHWIQTKRNQNLNILAFMTYPGQNVSFITFNMITDRQ